jgi:NAD(P)-dependent dehydrogenase (short-subunit alcohol dehydrogenase family)
VKLALITGGHRRLGAAIAARLATEGWTLALHGAHDATPDPSLAAVQSRTVQRQRPAFCGQSRGDRRAETPMTAGNQRQLQR